MDEARTPWGPQRPHVSVHKRVFPPQRLHGRALRLSLMLAIGGALLLAVWHLFTPAATAQTPPPTWRLLHPQGWITATPASATAVVTAPHPLDAASAAYQTSQDGGLSWSAWTTAHLTVTPAVSTTLWLTVTHLTLPDSAQDNRLRFRVATTDGLLYESPPFTLPVDTFPPAVRITAPAAGSVVTRILPAGTAHDATSGVTRVRLRWQDAHGRFWNGATWQTTPTWLPVTGTTTWTYTGPLPPWADGVYTLTARAEDAAGWTATSSPVTVTVDLSPPPAPADLRVLPETWTSTNRFTLRWTAPADPAGIAGAWYKVGAPPTSATDGTFVPGAREHITDITVPDEGIWTIYVWLQDTLGHVDATQHATATARYDATPPGAPIALTAAPTGWQRVNDFSLTWKNPPDLSGIAGAYYRFNTEPTHPTDGTFVPGADIASLEHIRVPGEGVYDIYLWLVDAAGNVDHRTRNLLPRAFAYDATPPQVQPVITGTLSATGWYTTPVDVYLRAVDALSGVAAVWYRLDQDAWQQGTHLALNDEGVHTLAFTAEDVAGNIAVTQALTLPIDLTPPTLVYTITPEPAPTGWYRSLVQVRVRAEDAISGIADVQYRLDEAPWTSIWPTGTLEIADEGRHTLWLRARDQAGHITEVGPVDIPIDRAAPVTAYLVEGKEGDGEWFVSPVTVTLTPTDTASGVISTYYRIDGGPWQEGITFTIATDGKHEVEFYSVDAAGWQEQGYPIPIWIDTTPPPAPPLVRVTPDSWSRENTFTIEWATPSDLSQVVGAYYKLDEPPTAADDGTFVPKTHRVENVTVPSEGAHTLYIWLRDGAGNADHTQAKVVEDALRYDATPPETELRFSGDLGNASWWRSPVTVTFAVSDLLSGPRTTFVSVNGGPWEERTAVVLAEDGKHTLRYYSVDQAGNVEDIRRETVRIDTQPPPPPADLRVVAQGWQRENRFEVRWTPPLDLSGIGGVRYTLNRAPTGPDDGFFSPGEERAYLRVPEEGVFDVYIWLVDGAGNGDPSQAAYFPQALWYDATPPTLTVTLDGERGENGWFTGPVTVHAVATDTVSGNVTLWLQVDGQSPITFTRTFTLDEEGRHRVRVWATDAAGNRTPAWEQDIAIDRTPPRARVLPLPPYLTTFTSLQGNLVGFTVRWAGEDLASGVVTYDVQVREGWDGSWQYWLTRTSQREGFFVGQIGHTYFFRVRARDAAGHLSDWTDDPYGDTYTHVEPVRNGDFGTGNFLFWQAQRVGDPGLTLNVKPAEHHTGITSPAAWLGDPIYGGAENPGLVPIGAAVISQTVTVPPLSQMRRPMLEFWYHMITWDVMYAPSHQRWQDTFEVRIVTPEEARLILRDGYQAQNNPPIKYVDYAVKHDLGWRRFRYDLTPFAGQTVVIEFSNWNRWDNLYNTYTILDDVRIVDDALTPRWALPLIMTPGTRRPPVSPTPQPGTRPPSPQEDERRER